MANVPLKSLNFPGLLDTYTIPNGLSESAKQALLQIARKVAYIDDQGQIYYNALYNALYPPADLSSISAAYTQSGAVYDTDTLDSLKTDLVVTAYYSDSSTQIVPAADYTLSGNLTVGTSVITASYDGKTATFNVTVTQAATLSSISAVFNQGSAVIYDTDSLDTLKQYLVVTATYSDSSTATVPSADYTLSGTLTAGTSTITVSYSGKTDTFNVTVTHYVQSYVTNGLVAKFDAIDNTGNGHDASATTWKDLVGSYDITVPSGKATWDSDALVFDGSQGNNIYPLTAWPTSAARTVEIVIMPTNISTNVVANVGKEGGGRCLWFLDSENAVAVSNASEKAYVSPLALSDIRQLSVSYSGNYATSHVIINGQETTTRGPTSHTMSNSSSNLVIGAQGHTGNYAFIGKIYAIRIYDRVLTSEEVAQNLAVDVDKYGLVM